MSLQTFNIKCPHCGKLNVYQYDTVGPWPPTVTIDPCIECKKRSVQPSTETRERKV